MFDLASIVDIENIIFTKPYWTKIGLRKLLNKNLSEKLWVFESQNKIIGYLIEQNCDDEISLLNVVIDLPFQNKGIGKKMINKYLGNVPGNCTVFLEVNRSNLIAIKIYTDLNFKKIDIRKNYYHDGEDALIMKYTK